MVRINKFVFSDDFMFMDMEECKRSPFNSRETFLKSCKNGDLC